jgi:RNA polymerase sigma factor (sigma-70 family)
MEEWASELLRGNPDTAWDRFVHEYRRLIFSAIRHYAHDHDVVMDVFASVCEALRQNDLRRLRSYIDQSNHRARFSTWLVTVVRHLTIDWFRQHEGRRRLAAVAQGLEPMQQRIYQHVFVDHRSHVEAFELIRSREEPTLTFARFLTELRTTYHAVMQDRRTSVLREFGGPLPAPLEEGAVVHEVVERAKLVEDALGKLTPVERTAVELYVMEELPADAVARILGLTNAKAVYNMVYRALGSVRSELTRLGVRREDL